MVTNFSATNSLVGKWMQELRDITLQDDRMRFRRNLERLGEVAAYEISKVLPYTEVPVQTPLAATRAMVLTAEPVIATIFRAGLPLYQGMLNFFDHADSAFIGAYRKHDKDGAFLIEQQYMASPPLAGRPLIVADPMLATGSSMVLALAALTEFDKPSEIHLVAAIAAPEGIELVKAAYPDVHIWLGAIDDGLTAGKYILPGLGDAGDLSFGEKRQF